jgi:hypothetical protein
LGSNVSIAEQDYINALATRYDGNPGSDRTLLDTAYANAMRELTKNIRLTTMRQHYLLKP